MTRRFPSVPTNQVGYEGKPMIFLIGGIFLIVAGVVIVAVVLLKK